MSASTVQKFDAPPLHWVGDGFPVQTLFNYEDHGRALDPFLMLDYALPRAFPAATQRRGVGVHPHRGFETVTIVYQGEVAHRDSTGQGGTIGAGDVQWMTAGAGILHEEYHSAEFTHAGGTLQVAQLWVNLPRRAKLTPARYQAILAADIPRASLPGGAGTVRVIAGQSFGLRGPALTHSSMLVADLQLAHGKQLSLPKPPGWCGALVVLSGKLQVDDTPATASQLVIVAASSERCELQAAGDTQVLVLQGEPLREPVVGYGPFVMNTRAEIAQAIEDFNNGRFRTGAS